MYNLFSSVAMLRDVFYKSQHLNYIPGLGIICEPEYFEFINVSMVYRSGPMIFYTQITPVRMCVNIGKPKTIQFSFDPNGK